MGSYANYLFRRFERLLTMESICERHWSKMPQKLATILLCNLIYYTGNRQASIDVTLRLEGLNEPKKYALELTDLPAHVKPPPKSFYEVSSHSRHKFQWVEQL